MSSIAGSMDGRLKALVGLGVGGFVVGVEQHMVDLQQDLAHLKEDVADVREDLAYVKGQVDLLIQLSVPGGADS